MEISKSMAEDKMMPASECAQHIAKAIAKRKINAVTPFCFFPFVKCRHTKRTGNKQTSTAE